MAAPVRVEDRVWSDPRVELLGALLGVPQEFAIEVAVSRLVKLWGFCTDRGAHVLPERLVTTILRSEAGADALIDADLGERTDGGIYVRGTRGRIEWLEKKRAAARKGAESRWGNGGRDSETGATGNATSDAGGMPPGEDPACPLAPAPVREHPPKSPQGDSQSKPKRQPKPLHPKASALAEHLRGAILAEKPDHALGKPSGWTDKRRKSWEKTCHHVLATDGRSFGRACELVDWVFGDQGGSEARFVVESPKALRDKWDKIETAMQRKGGGSPGAKPQSALSLLGPGWRDA